MQPNNEEITKIIHAATEGLMRETLIALINSSATPDQIACAAQAIAFFSSIPDSEADVFANSAEVNEVETLRQQLASMVQDYEDQAEQWNEEFEKLTAENLTLREKLESAVAPRNGHAPKVENDSEELSPREAARSRIRAARDRRSGKLGFGGVR